MHDTIKIVVIGMRGFPNVQGGIEKHCEELYPLLTKLGVDVTVVTRKPYVDASIQEFRGVRLISIDCPKNKFLEAVVHTFRAALLAKKLKPDLVHIHAVGPSLLVPLVRLFGLKVVMTHHGPDYERKKWNILAKAVIRIGELVGVTFADKVITISKTIAKEIKERCGRDVVVIPNGFSQNLRVLVDDGSEVMQRYGIEKNNYILSVGRFVPEKGFHDLIAAFQLFQDANQPVSSNIKLVIVGGADHEDEYSQKLKVLAQKTPNVLLTGRLSGAPLADLYAYAGLFVIPSYYEGLPIVLLEALSFGLNCLASDIPANREVHLDPSRYFLPGDIKNLSDKMPGFLSCPLTENEKKDQATRVAAEYDWNAIAIETKAVYTMIINR